MRCLLVLSDIVLRMVFLKEMSNHYRALTPSAPHHYFSIEVDEVKFTSFIKKLKKEQKKCC